MTTAENTLTKGQTVMCDMTGLGHMVRATYIAPIPASKKYPLGGHKVRGTNPTLGDKNPTLVVSRTPKAV